MWSDLRHVGGCIFHTVNVQSFFPACSSLLHCFKVPVGPRPVVRSRPAPPPPSHLAPSPAFPLPAPSLTHSLASLLSWSRCALPPPHHRRPPSLGSPLTPSPPFPLPPSFPFPCPDVRSPPPSPPPSPSPYVSPPPPRPSPPSPTIPDKLDTIWAAQSHCLYWLITLFA